MVKGLKRNIMAESATRTISGARDRGLRVLGIEPASPYHRHGANLRKNGTNWS